MDDSRRLFEKDRIFAKKKIRRIIMNNEVRKETNLEHCKDELKEIFKTNWAFPWVIVAQINKNLVQVSEIV